MDKTVDVHGHLQSAVLDFGALWIGAVRSEGDGSLHWLDNTAMPPPTL